MLEKQIEKNILNFLHWQPDCFAWKNPSIGLYDPKKGSFRKSKNPHQINGVSDIICIKKSKFGCKVLFLEVKNIKGRQTKSQKEFENNVKLHGGHYFVVRSIQDVEIILEMFRNEENFSTEEE